MIALASLLLFTVWQQTWRAAEMKAANLVQLISQDIDRNFEVFDLSLQAALDGIHQPAVKGMPFDLQRMVLFDRAASAGDLGAMKIVDRQGNVVLDSFREDPPPENVSERDYFTTHRDRPDAGLYVSLPTDLQNGLGAVITLSRRVSDADGTFAGIVFGTIRLAYFQTLFAQLDVGSRGTINVLRDDGRLLFRSPNGLADIGRDVSRSPSYAAFVSWDSGTTTGRSVIDGVERLNVFRKLRHAPGRVVVALAVDEISAPWLLRLVWIGGPVMVLAMLTVAASYRSEVHLAERDRAEAALSEANGQLRQLARIDSLTGLGNRRVFDEMLVEELGRTAKAGGMLGLLLIDADHFKAFNDLHGHHLGDNALRVIASVLRTELTEAGDHACRVGGEEFAVILPQTKLHRASSVAESIRRRIAACQIPGDGPLPLKVTVSIGLACIAPTQTTSASDVYLMADSALYVAKGKGRNRVAIEERPVARGQTRGPEASVVQASAA